MLRERQREIQRENTGILEHAWSIIMIPIALDESSSTNKCDKLHKYSFFFVVK